MTNLISALEIQIGTGSSLAVTIGTDLKATVEVPVSTSISSCKIKATFTAATASSTTAKYSTDSATAASGTNLTSGTQSAAIDLTVSKAVYIYAVNGTTTENYAIIIKFVDPFANITKVGWFAAKCFTGDLSTLDTSTGKVTLTIPDGFVPKYVVNVNFSGNSTAFGLTGNVDLDNGILYVRNGTSAYTTKSREIKYAVILMQ